MTTTARRPRTNPCAPPNDTPISCAPRHHVRSRRAQPFASVNRSSDMTPWSASGPPPTNNTTVPTSSFCQSSGKSASRARKRGFPGSSDQIWAMLPSCEKYRIVPRRMLPLALCVPSVDRSHQTRRTLVKQGPRSPAHTRVVRPLPQGNNRHLNGIQKRSGNPAKAKNSFQSAPSLPGPFFKAAHSGSGPVAAPSCAPRLGETARAPTITPRQPVTPPFPPRASTTTVAIVRHAARSVLRRPALARSPAAPRDPHSAPPVPAARHGCLPRRSGRPPAPRSCRHRPPSTGGARW